MRTRRNFYEHRDTGEIFVIETSWEGRILASKGPIEDNSRPLDEYELTDEKNAELGAISDRLLLFGPG